MVDEKFEPRIIAFCCNWCTYTGADLAGISRMIYPANVKIIRTMCSGRVDPQFVLKAFREGADGVMICGCHPGDCHYQEGNIKTMRRFPLLVKMLKQLGIEEDRIMLEWVSASEGDKFARICYEMTERVKELGPLNIKRHAPEFKQAETYPPAEEPAKL
ncbi:MAG: hydrogenase iron-sulfur subunit [Candidatus Eremiobacteraeota bacterium]|nr:hydrogenase iron-sulfur subunit [Candidatus Eremiobacteraeota bacterium]